MLTFSIYLKYVFLFKQNVPTGPNNKPKLPILIAQCGEM